MADNKRKKSKDAAISFAVIGIGLVFGVLYILNKAIK